MGEVGFEPTQPEALDLQSSPSLQLRRSPRDSTDSMEVPAELWTGRRVLHMPRRMCLVPPLALLRAAPATAGRRPAPSRPQRGRRRRAGSFPDVNGADLAGRTIAIAGAAGGLGPTVASRLAAAGANLALTDVVEDRLGEVATGLALPDGRLDHRVVDLLDVDEARSWASALTERFGGVDALIHLVGGWKGGDPITTTPLEDYEFLHDLLVHTVQHATRAFYDTLTTSEHGRFVIVSSAQAQAPDGTNASYAATKAAAETWTLALANSFAADDSAATANIVVVNAILTPQMREANPDTPYRTFTSVEDIAEAIAFLCSDAAAKMNGKRLALYP